MDVKEVLTEVFGELNDNHKSNYVTVKQLEDVLLKLHGDEEEE